VKEELANDNAEVSNASQASFDTLPSALGSRNHVFIVSADLEVTTAEQQLCGLRAGDMLQLNAPDAGDTGFVSLRVASSKRMDCPAGTMVSVSLPDLQEMQNDFQAHVESGLQMLHDNQGRNGLPSVPANVVNAPTHPALAFGSVSETELSVMLNQQKTQADESEAAATVAAF